MSDKSALVVGTQITPAGHDSAQCGKKEREICELKVEKDISYAHARRLYQETHQAPVIRPYAAVVWSPSEAPSQDAVIRDWVEKLE